MIEFPEVNDVAETLYDWIRFSSHVYFDGQNDTDVRLQVHEDGSWELHSGDPQFDTDHRGYWGESVLNYDDDRADCLSKAEEMIEQAKDRFAEQEGYDPDLPQPPTDPAIGF